MRLFMAISRQSAADPSPGRVDGRAVDTSRTGRRLHEQVRLRSSGGERRQMEAGQFPCCPILAEPYKVSAIAQRSAGGMADKTISARRQRCQVQVAQAGHPGIHHVFDVRARRAVLGCTAAPKTVRGLTSYKFIGAAVGKKPDRFRIRAVTPHPGTVRL